MKLKVNEIFYSIQGETTTTGFPSLFIRLTGCNLHCRYCDTEYAREEGTMLSIEQILEHVHNYPEAHHITLTGGSPSARRGLIHSFPASAIWVFRFRLKQMEVFC